MLIMLVLECPGLVCPETIWSHFWLLQGRDVKTLGNLLGGLGGCFDRFFPRPWALGTRLGATQQPRFRLPQKAQAHTHNAVPCHAMPYNAMHLPCDRQFFGSGHYNMGANSTSVSQPTSTISKMQCMSPTCFSCCHPFVLSWPSFAPPVPRPTPHGLSDAGDIVLSVTFPVAWTRQRPSLVHRCYSVPSIKLFLSTASSQHPGSWQSRGTSPVRPSHTLTSRTKGLFAGSSSPSSLLRVLTSFETSIQQSRLVWRR